MEVHARRQQRAAQQAKLHGRRGCENHVTDIARAKAVGKQSTRKLLRQQRRFRLMTAQEIDRRGAPCQCEFPGRCVIAHVVRCQDKTACSNGVAVRVFVRVVAIATRNLGHGVAGAECRPDTDGDKQCGDRDVARFDGQLASPFPRAQQEDEHDYRNDRLEQAARAVRERDEHSSIQREIDQRWA